MKIILANPPDGFESEAHFRLPVKGEWYLGDSGNYKPIQSDKDFTYVSAIVLTPKKPKRFVYEVVRTFEEASIYKEDADIRLRHASTGEIYYMHKVRDINPGEWVKIVEEQ